MSSENLVRYAVGERTWRALQTLADRRDQRVADVARSLLWESLDSLGLLDGAVEEKAPRAPRRPIKGPGFVYLARNSDLHKIGLSIDPVRRMDEIDAELVHSVAVPNMLAAERFLHNWFQPSRVTGEWFNLSAEDVAWFVALEEVPA